MKMKRISIGLFLFLSYSMTSQADIYFNPDFLELRNKNVIDLSQFQNDEQLAGYYYIDIYVNNNFVTTQNTLFNKNKINTTLQPCLLITELRLFGVKVDDYPGLVNKNNECANLSAIPDAKEEFDFNAQHLYLSIPQIALEVKPRGYVDLDSIDDGVNAFLLNYSYSGSKSHDFTKESLISITNYANLRPGINVGAWRLRNYTTWSNGDNQSTKWNTIYTYAFRNINSLKSNLILGDGISPSMVFDSVPYRGLQITTDEEMYPDSVRGYAPVVRGIAPGNAQITIRQNGYIIYQADVPAGPFEITDLYPTGSSGDLYVTIKEHNGNEQFQIIPFASLPILQRQGYAYYSVTGGEYRSYDGRIDKTKFGQFTLIYGLPYGITTYGGSQMSEHYQSYSLGIGKNLGKFGAISLDVTKANSTLSNHEKYQGQSSRFRYNKNLNDIGTNIALAGYRYSTKGFYSLSEVFNGYRDTDYVTEIERRKNRGEITLNQNLGDIYGSISASIIRQNYWNSDRKTQSATLGYNNNSYGISYGLNYTYNRNTNSCYFHSVNCVKSEDDHQLSLSASVPFTVFEDIFYYNLNSNSSSNSASSGSVGLSASQLNNRLNWSVQQSFTNKGQGAAGNMNLSYKGQYGEVSGGAGYSKNNYNLYYGTNGSLVVHSDGIVLGQQLGENAALVEIPKAKGVPILNQAGVVTNNQGYALIPHITAYRRNVIDIDTSELPENTEMALTSQSVTPSRGALAKASFVANIGYRALMIITFTDGKPLPFGAQAIFSDNNHFNGMVGSDGAIYLSGLTERGSFIIQYNEKQQCQVNYNLAGTPNYLGIYKITAVCH